MNFETVAGKKRQVMKRGGGKDAGKNNHTMIRPKPIKTRVKPASGLARIGENSNVIYVKAGARLKITLDFVAGLVYSNAIPLMKDRSKGPQGLYELWGKTTN